MKPPSLTFETVGCVRGGRPLWEGLSFTCEAGGAVVVTGANGAGKSSLIRVAAGLLAPAAGKVTIAGRCALLAEAAALDGDRALRSALLFWARLDGVADAKGRIANALVALDLSALADVPVRLLSTGQRRRAALARVVASAAPVWLLDEPANGLDAAAVARLGTLIAEHRAAGGLALVATHLPLAAPGAQDLAL